MNHFAKQLKHHKKYQEHLQRLQALEVDRVYCKHDLEHFCTVGEIALAVAKRNKSQISEDMLWACALLHDIGRVEQYEIGISHSEASLAFAREILSSFSWDENAISAVCHAIGEHRQRRPVTSWLHHIDQVTSLPEILAFADQMSRACYSCKVYDTCKWREEEKVKNEDWKQRV